MGRDADSCPALSGAWEHSPEACLGEWHSSFLRVPVGYPGIQDFAHAYTPRPLRGRTDRWTLDPEASLGAMLPCPAQGGAHRRNSKYFRMASLRLWSVEMCVHGGLGIPYRQAIFVGQIVCLRRGVCRFRFLRRSHGVRRRMRFFLRTAGLVQPSRHRWLPTRGPMDYKRWGKRHISPPG